MSQVHEYQERWARQATLAGVPGTPDAFHVLANRDDVPLVEMIEQEVQAITGVSSGGGAGG